MRRPTPGSVSSPLKAAREIEGGSTSWSAFLPFTELQIQLHAPRKPGVVLYWRPTISGWKCFHVGYGASIERVLLDHFAGYRSNDVVTRYITRGNTRFHFRVEREVETRRGIAKFLWDLLKPEGTRKDPGGMPVPVDLPSLDTGVGSLG